MPKTNKNKSGLLDTWGRNNRKLQDKKCESCGKVFRPINSKKRACSRECGYLIRSNGSLKLRKKESWWVNKKGYVEGRVWIDEYTQIKVKQHRWVVEQYIGIKLSPTDDVHHINGIKTDNRIENLQIINHSEHTKITNNRDYKKGYKMNISEEERNNRSIRMKALRANQITKATKQDE